MKKNIALLFVAFCVVLVCVLYISDTNKNNEVVPSEELLAPAFLFQSATTDSVVGLDDDEFENLLKRDTRKSFRFFKNDEEETLEVDFEVVGDNAPKDLHNVRLIYENFEYGNFEDEFELANVYLRIDTTDYEIFDGLELLQCWIQFNPIVFSANDSMDSIIAIDDGVLTEYVINNDDEFDYTRKNDTTVIVFAVDADEELEAIKLVYYTSYEGTDIVDVAINKLGKDYRIVHGLDIVKNSLVSTETFPIMDGVLIKDDTSFMNGVDTTLF